MRSRRLREAPAMFEAARRRDPIGKVVLDFGRSGTADLDQSTLCRSLELAAKRRGGDCTQL